MTQEERAGSPRASEATFGATHPYTRLGRVVQQLSSFARMHGMELEGLASQMEAEGLTEHAARIRTFSELHKDEADLVLDEVERVRSVLMAEAATPEKETETDPDSAGGEAPDRQREDPARDSPRRARWLAEEARKSAELARPKSRRDLFRSRRPLPD